MEIAKTEKGGEKLIKKLNLKFIENQRELLHYSLQDMSDYMGFKSPSTYQKYEKGDYKFKADMLPTLMKVLQVKSIDDFFCK